MALPGKSASPLGNSAKKSKEDTSKDDALAGPSTMSWLIRCPCIGPRDDKGDWESLALLDECDSDSGNLPKDSRPPIRVYTSTLDGVQDSHVFSRDATVIDVRRLFRTLNGKQYKLLTTDGVELHMNDRLEDFLDSEDGTELRLTKVCILHPADLDTLTELEPKKDAFQCDVFQLDILKVSIGVGKYGNQSYTKIEIEEPTIAFQKPGKLEVYKKGYDYFDSLERYEKGDGRSRYRLLPARKQELEDEFKARLPEFRELSAQIFENPNRIYKLRAMMDKDEFPCTRENLYRFLNVFFELLTDRCTMLL